MRRFVMTVTALAAFRAMVATAQAETPSPGQVPSEEFHYSDWATSANYHKLFIAMVRQQRYPRVVEGRVFNGIVLYHAAFEPYPGPGCPGRECIFHFFSYHGLTPERFAKEDDKLLRAGYRIIHKQSVQLRGREYIQVTWVQIGPEV
jgi:Bacterial tandem repeat domain 1